MKITFTEDGKKAIVDQKLEMGLNFLGFLPTINGVEVHRNNEVKQNGYELVNANENGEVTQDSLYEIVYMPSHNYTEDETEEGTTYTSWHKGILKLRLDNNTFPNIEIDYGITVNKIVVYGYRLDDSQYVKNKDQDSLTFLDFRTIVPFIEVEFDNNDDTTLYNEVIDGCVREIVINLSMSDKDNENLVSDDIPNQFRAFELVDDGLGSNKGMVIKDNSVNVEGVPGLGEFDHINGREGVIATISKVVVAEDIKTNNVTYGFQSPARLHLNSKKKDNDYTRQMLLSQSYTDERNTYTYWDGVAMSYRNDDIEIDNKGILEIEPVGIDTCSIVVNSRGNDINTNSFLVHSNNNKGSLVQAIHSNDNETTRGVFIESDNNIHWNDKSDSNIFINTNFTYSIDGDKGPNLFSNNTLIDSHLIDNNATTYDNTFIHLKGIYDNGEHKNQILESFFDNVVVGGRANMFKKVQSSILLGSSDMYLKNLDNTIVIGTYSTNEIGAANMSLKGLKNSVIVGEMNTRIADNDGDIDDNVYSFGGKLSLETWNPERDKTRSTYLSFFGGLNNSVENDADYSEDLSSYAGEKVQLKKIYSIFGTGEYFSDTKINRRNGLRIVSVEQGIAESDEYASLAHGVELISLNSEDDSEIVRSVILTSEGIILNDVINSVQYHKSWYEILMNK